VDESILDRCTALLESTRVSDEHHEPVLACVQKTIRLDPEVVEGGRPVMKHGVSAVESREGRHIGHRVRIIELAIRRDELGVELPDLTEVPVRAARLVDVFLRHRPRSISRGQIR
jgi:hypothetical protein